MELLETVRSIAIALALLLAVAGMAGLLPVLWPWRRWSKAGMFVALGAQTGIGAVAFARQQRAPSAFLLPLAGTLLLAAWLRYPRAPFLAYAAPLIELGIVLGLTVYASRTYRRENRAFEHVLGRLLERWFPGKGSVVLRLAALDIGGFRYLAGGWRRPPPAGISYHRNNATLAFVALVALAALPELFILELFTAGKPLLWHAIDVCVHLYAIFCAVAIFVSFRDRPHTFENGELVVRRGVSDVMRVPLETIERVEPARPLARRERRASAPIAYLGLFESPLLKLSLSRGCELERAIGRPQMVETIYIAVDEPRAAIAEIRRRLPPSV